MSLLDVGTLLVKWLAADIVLHDTTTELSFARVQTIRQYSCGPFLTRQSQIFSSHG